MFRFVRNIFNIEKDTRFAARILFLSAPTAIVFLILATLGLISPLLAIASLASVILFNLLMLFPITFELQQIRKYISTMAAGGDFDEKAMSLSDKDAKEIVSAVNAMHSFWAYKTDALEAQTISDTAVLDSLPDPIMMIDRAGNILGANLSARTLFGANVTDKTVEKLFASQSFIRATFKVLNKESEAENLIFYIKKPRSQKLYAHIKQLPWLSKGRAVAVISIYNMTKSMKIEQMQSDFVANASHELRTPLSIISGFIETLQTSAKNDAKAREKFLGIMREQTDYMALLIENLLSLSKIELKQDEKPNEIVDILEIAEEAAEALSQKAAERKIKIKINFEDNVPEITADRGQIKQLIQNLADNALKYGVSQSDVTIAISKSMDIPNSKSHKTANGEAVAIAINNKGAKISADNLARLTERFYRMQEHKDLNIKGTGLGLSIAKQIILRHRGNLTVTSTSYNGTTFTVYLPISQDDKN